MKKNALKGLIILCIVLLVCFFFSGTIKTLTTAKVMFVTPGYGKLKEQIVLTGYLTFLDTEEIHLTEKSEGMTFQVKKVNVTKGSKVSAGDVMLEVDVSIVDERIALQQNVYQKALESILALERQYAGLRLSRADREWIVAYDGLLSAQANSTQAHLALDVIAQTQGVVLQAGRVPKGIQNEELLAAQSEVDQADMELQAAQTMMDRAARTGITEDAYQYTIQYRALVDERDQAYTALVELLLLRQTNGYIIASHDGYVVDVLVNSGEMWSGNTAALVISAENSLCYLRAELPENTRVIADGSLVLLTGQDTKPIKAYVSKHGYNTNGKPILDIEINASDISMLGTTYSLMNKGIPMSINYVSASNTALLPIGAIRGSGDDQYIFIATEKYDVFGHAIYVIEKKAITILDETSEMAAVPDSGNMERVVYMEDRSIAEGSEVIPYDE